MTLLVSAGSQACVVPHSSGTGRNPVPSLCVQVIRARARSWLLGGDRGLAFPSLPGTHRTSASWRSSGYPSRAGCASRQPHNTSGRARSRRLTPVTIAASCGSLVVSCARLPRMPACLGPLADLPAPGALESPAPSPTEVVLHPRCLPAGGPTGGPRGRRGGEGVPGAAPPTSQAARPRLFRPLCSLARRLMPLSSLVPVSPGRT